MNETIFLIGGMSDIDIATNQSLKNTIKYLSEFGYQIHMFTAFPQNYRILQDPKKIFNGNVVFHRSPNFLTPLFDLGKFLKDLLGRPWKKKVSPGANQTIKYYDEYSFFGRLFYVLFFFLYVPVEMLRVAFYYLKLKPSLFYGINGQGSALATYLGQIFRRPIIHRWHGCAYTEEDVIKLKTKFKDKLLSLDGSFAKMLPSDASIVTNDGTHGKTTFQLLGVRPEKIHFWMNGMDLEDMKLPEGWNAGEFKHSLGLQGKKVLVMTSRLVLWKRVDRGIDCVYRLVKQHKMEDVVLLILGQGQESQKLKEMVQTLGIQDHVRFLGAVPHTDVSKYYSIADVFLSLYDVSNLGNPLLEALCGGLPIVTLEDGSTSELLQDGENAFLIPHEHLEEMLPLKVKMLLTDELLRRKMAEKSKKTSQEKILSWEERMRLEDQLIQRLISV